MAVIFSDEFESGDLSKWLQSIINGDIGVVQQPHKGTYAGYFRTNPSLAETRSVVYTEITASNVYARAYFFIAQGIGALQSNDRFYLIQFKGSAGNLVANIGIRREALEPTRWCMWCAGLNTHRYGESAISTTPRWICVELHYDRAAGIFEVWIDGNLEITVTAPAPVDVARVEFGIQKTGATGTAFDPTGQYIIEVHGDECVIADQYIGPALPPTGCFIATAAYGTPLAPQLHTLRRFRDRCLPAKVTRTYYKVSPPVANAIAKHDTLKALVRAVLKPIVQFLHK